MVVLAIVRYPPDRSLAALPDMTAWPSGDKVLTVLFSCAVLLAIDLAAYALGRALHPLLRRGAPAGLATGLERLAVGFLALAAVALALAAVHAVRAIAPVTLALAAVGAVAAVRGARMPHPSRAAAMLGAAGGVLMVSPFLAAWLPDYGWDAFAYHLALPERYLFRNRVVVTPLFPHSAFPQAVEMLYLDALALGSAAAAKLVHLHFGVLALLAAFAMARPSSSRAGVFAVLILAADPVFNWELGVAYNDLAACFLGVLAVAALDEWRRTSDGGALRMAALLGGGCVAVRYTAGVVPVAMAAVVWLARGRPPRAKARATATLVALGALALSPWLLRNLVTTGNPVSPAAQSLFHAPGREYFSPVALAQSVAFTAAVGFGRGLVDLALLPINLTLRANVGDYSGFGFRVGVAYLLGLLAFALAARHVATARLAATAAGVITLLWFFTFQEPRYLLPGLGLAAVAGGIGLDALLPRRGPAALLWAIPLAALAHTQATPALLLPWRYGYALGGLSVEAFEAQDPALALVPVLRRTLGPGDRLLPIHEPRGFFFRGLDYVPATAPETMHLVHESGTPEELASRLRALGVTHVLVNTNNAARFRPWFVDGYSAEDDARAHATLDGFLAGHTTPVAERQGVFVRRLR
jgi:hypothetical protein